MQESQNTLTARPTGIVALSDREIEQVSGGVEMFTFYAPNGSIYENIVKVTYHYWEDVDGGREYFVDAAYVPRPPDFNDLDGWIVTLQNAGFQVYY